MGVWKWVGLGVVAVATMLLSKKDEDEVAAERYLSSRRKRSFDDDEEDDEFYNPYDDEEYEGTFRMYDPDDDYAIMPLGCRKCGGPYPECTSSCDSWVEYREEEEEDDDEEFHGTPSSMPIECFKCGGLYPSCTSTCELFDGEEVDTGEYYDDDF